MPRTKLPPLFPQTMRHSTTLNSEIKRIFLQAILRNRGDFKKPFHLRPVQEQALRRQFASLLLIQMGEKRKMTLMTKY